MEITVEEKNNTAERHRNRMRESFKEALKLLLTEEHVVRENNVHFERSVKTLEELINHGNPISHD